ncbi:voltage-gated ion channel superfamily [Achlya hypogyna]|uniref:Voltage-gated ion channel superfamily n=1 Tax=Achlya hypogyna TaxID=1202772 RepID=A0A1V9YFV7_ACHHY|nr:voltage-gated ion channel superfamily [Achlya hypogyna]
MTAPPPVASRSPTGTKIGVVRASQSVVERKSPRSPGLKRAKTTRIAKQLFTKPTTDAVQILTKPQVTDRDFHRTTGATEQPTRWCGIEPIHPQSAFMRNWDLLSIALLFFTAVVTPYETAFLTPSYDGLFVINCLVDICFFIDMVLRFFLVFFDDQTHMWITDAKLIVLHYLKGWFIVDLFSIIPFDIVGLVMTSPTLGRMRFLRILRLFRLMKIVRVVQDASVFQYWEVRMSMNYATLGLTKFCFFVFMIAHWIACVFRVITDIEYSYNADGTRYNWLTDHYLGPDALADCRPGFQYVAALYWSVMTLTTIGYGDLVPSTPGERGLSIVCMLLGGGTYAYVVGGVCRILSAMDAATTEFHQTIDTLNEYCQYNQLPRELSARLREYFFSSRSLLREKKNRDLLLAMSPGLRGEVALYNNQWISKIDFFHCDDDRERSLFITALAMVLRPECFPPSEAVIREGEYNTKMYLVERGFATRGKVMVGAGSFFGEDIILTYRQRKMSVRAFTYLHVQVLTKHDLEDILASGMYPEIFRNIRSKVLKTAFKNNFVRLTEHSGTLKRMETLRRLTRQLVPQTMSALGPSPAMLSPKAPPASNPAPPVNVESVVDGVSTFIKENRSHALSDIANRLDMILKRIDVVEKAVLGDNAGAPVALPSTPNFRTPVIRDHDPMLSYRTSGFVTRHRSSVGDVTGRAIHLDVALL